jgi:UDP-N-acetylmuramoyl-L-alanyl-D-glutamate--2,6-diaminopimelate ligase
MRLSEIYKALKEDLPDGQVDVEIISLTVDSRRVKPGTCFVAIQGLDQDGHDFIPDAIERGANIVVGERDLTDLPVPYVRVVETRLAWAQLAAAWHGYPARSLVMLGVTGTDGKSTTCNLLFQILKQAGIPTGMITTVNTIIGDEVSDTGLHVTTPDAFEVQSYLNRMVDAGMTHCILETTSHGLAQHRVSACDFDIAVVTNITHEHIDYHGSVDAYRHAKASLFDGLSESYPKRDTPSRLGVLNRDDSSFPLLTDTTKVNQVSYGVEYAADVLAKDIESTSTGLRFRILSSDSDVLVDSPLIGRYNVHNILAAFTAAVLGLRISPEIVVKGIENLEAVPGRMEVIDLGQPFLAIVDFAHTPNALRQALLTSRELTEGQVICVFGSAGLRDREKRRLMAEVSAELADRTILTAEDPRTESLDGILEEMAEGARNKGLIEGGGFWRVPDRGEALRFSLRLAQPGDLVIACGKGHEQSMCFGTIEYPWDDRTALRAALSEFLDTTGPEMPQLPTSRS